MLLEFSAIKGATVSSRVNLSELERSMVKLTHRNTNTHTYTYKNNDEIKCFTHLIAKIFSSQTWTVQKTLQIIAQYTPFVTFPERSSVLLGVNDNIAMKQMDGTLRDYYAHRDRVAQGNAIRDSTVGCPGGVIHIVDALISVLTFLSIMHRHGMFHCDIKDESVLFELDGKNIRFALSDFGHMRNLYHCSVGNGGTQLGTPGSRSPFMYGADEDGMDRFLEDNIMSQVVVEPEALWSQYESVRAHTTKHSQVTKNDLFAVGVIAARIVDTDVRDFARACVCATSARSLWTANDALEWLEDMRARKMRQEEDPNAPFVLDVRMQGGPTTRVRMRRLVTR